MVYRRYLSIRNRPNTWEADSVELSQTPVPFLKTIGGRSKNRSASGDPRHAGIHPDGARNWVGTQKLGRGFKCILSLPYLKRRRRPRVSIIRTGSNNIEPISVTHIMDEYGFQKAGPLLIQSITAKSPLIYRRRKGRDFLIYNIMYYESSISASSSNSTVILSSTVGCT
jgi:hypothetical protein